MKPEWKPRIAFVEIDPPNGGEPCGDTRYFQRVIKLPYSNWSTRIRNVVDNWVRENAWNHSWGTEGHCGHQHDCCGCQFAQSAQWTYSYGKLTLNITQHFNY